MVEIDLGTIRVRCRNCQTIKELDHFEIPIDIECCEEPDIVLEDEVELEITE